jgi:hypothetical protein
MNTNETNLVVGDLNESTFHITKSALRHDPGLVHELT